MTRYLPGLHLPCYTDPRMFQWFGKTSDDFQNVNTAEANFIILHNSFINSVIMKAWVSCALDENCIAPKGSFIYGSLKNFISGCDACGCHRFDQDAMSIVLSFFFGFPSNDYYYPAFAITQSESFFYQIMRRNVKVYIFDQLKSLFSIY